MSDEIKLSDAELREMVNTFSQHADHLKKLLEVELQRNKELNSENAGWLDTYQKLSIAIAGLKTEQARFESYIQQLQSENAALKAEVSRLESRIREHQGES